MSEIKKSTKRPALKNKELLIKKNSKKLKMIKVESGSVVTDLNKKRWKLEELLGVGGFGQVFTAKCIDENSKLLSKFDCEYALKIEPEASGPLFTEIAFYQRVLNQFVKEKKLSYLAIAYYITNGISELNGIKFRFLVLPKLGIDIETIWNNFGKKFSPTTICQIGIKIIDAIEFIHKAGYVHADIKPSNILTDFILPELSGKIYLTDFGLVSQYNESGKHKIYKQVSKYKHNGTIELTSCDAHNGVAPSRRGDMEIIGYMLLRFFISQLPWEMYINDVNKVANLKFKFSENYLTEICKLILTRNELLKRFSKGMIDYFDKTFKMDYHNEPDYENFKLILKKILFTKTINKTIEKIIFKKIK